MVEAGPTQRDSNQQKVQCGQKYIKSNIFQETLCQLLNLGYLELSQQILGKLVEPGQRNLSWKKGGLGLKTTTLH